MKILAFAASLRRDSLNRKLISLAASMAGEAEAQVDLADFHEFDMPLFDADIMTSTGFPAGSQEFARRVAAADGLMISSPEYNYSFPGTIKNAIDWVSRMKPMPLRGKTAMLLGASTSQVGAIRGLWQLRIPLEGLGVVVYPDMYALPWADKAFDERGELNEQERQGRLRDIVRGYLTIARKLAAAPE